MKKKRYGLFPSSAEDAQRASRQKGETPAAKSPSFRLAYTDEGFLLRPELRPVRLQLELLKPELLQQEQGIEDTIAIFGSARISDPLLAGRELEAAKRAVAEQPQDQERQVRLRRAERMVANSRYYEEARRLAFLITGHCQQGENCRLVVVTGGGPGIMEAANRGAQEAGGKSIGLNIVLPFEQNANPYITPELSFQFHYFAIRKMHFLIRTRAMVAFPGGFGTLDELFETLTLIQTKKIEAFPIVLVGREFWQKVVDFSVLVEEGVISLADLDLFCLVDSADEAWAELQQKIDFPASLENRSLF